MNELWVEQEKAEVLLHIFKSSSSQSISYSLISSN